MSKPSGINLKGKRIVTKRALKISLSDAKLMHELTPFIDEDEFEWIEYIQKCLRSLWSLNDETWRIHDKKRSRDFKYAFNLARDLESFEMDEKFQSSEAKIWDIFRLIAVGRILKKDTVIVYTLSIIAKIEASEDHLFNQDIKSLIFCAKIECYIGIYDLLSTGSTTELIIGQSEHYFRFHIEKGYKHLLSMLNNSLTKDINPNHAVFPGNPYLISRVAALIESRFPITDFTKELFYLSNYTSDAEEISHTEEKSIKNVSIHRLQHSGREEEKRINSWNKPKRVVLPQELPFASEHKTDKCQPLKIYQQV